MKRIILTLVSASVIALAQENSLVTHTELGFIDTQGNTQTQSFNLDSSAKKSIDKHQFSFALDAQYATTDDVETKNKYATLLNYDYSFTQRLAFGYLVGYKVDKFSGFNYQAYTGPAVKYALLQTKEQNLNAQASVLYSQDNDRVTDENNNYSAYGLGVVYNWQINPNLKFDQEVNYRSSFEDSKNYFVYSKTAFASKISDLLSAGVSYKVDYVNLPSDFKEHTDRTFSFNLIIDY